jgi:hypothetical protein
MKKAWKKDGRMKRRKTDAPLERFKKDSCLRPFHGGFHGDFTGDHAALRADYTLGPVGADEGGERIGRVSGMVFAPGADGALSLASEWVVLAKMGKPFHFESRNERFNTVIDMVISPMTKEQVEEKIGGKIPESSSCDTASDLTAHDLLKSNEDNCCEKQCGSGTKGIRCCGGIGCCNFRQEENC